MITQDNQQKKTDLKISELEDSSLNSVLANWKLDNLEIMEQYNEKSKRKIFRVKANYQDYLLKGFSDDVSESTIQSNVQAHLFLGNKNNLAPKVYQTINGEYYIKAYGCFFYLMEFIDGRVMGETSEDEYKIGKLLSQLHSLQGYDNPSPLTQNKGRYYTWFRDKSFVKEFDEILDKLPDFEKLDQCLVHTDCGPHNTMMKKNGDVVFIDLDDTGIGSRYLDLGWPFIMQFVNFNHDTKEMNYRFDLAQGFLQGYFGKEQISREEFDLIFQGAIQMHISYMQAYGPDSVNDLWKILLFGIKQKEKLWEEINKNNI